MKTAIYIRVSTEDQAKEGYSLEVQREHLEPVPKYRLQITNYKLQITDYKLQITD